MRYDVEVDDIGNFWIVEARAHKVQPKGIHWFRDPFYVGGLVICNITIAVTIFSDQLQIPTQKQLFVRAQSEQRKVDLEGIKQLERERILASPEYQQFIQTQKRSKEE